MAEVRRQSGRPSRSSNEPVRRVRLIAPGRPSSVVLRPRRSARQGRISSSGYVRFRSQRKYFIIKVYVLATVFIVITIYQWLFILMNKNILKYFQESYFITFLSAFSALLLLGLFSFFADVRYTQPYSTLMALVIVELSTFGLMSVFLECHHKELESYIILTLATYVVFTIIGIMLPRDLTLDIVWLTVCSFVFYLVTSVILVVVIITEMQFPSLPFAFVIIILMLQNIMYIAQIIIGNRSTALRWRDYVFAALLNYFNFIVLFIMIAFIASILTIKFGTFSEGHLPFF